MKTKLIAVTAVLFAASAFAATFNAVKPQASAKISGDYVEARSASVFCGPCHYNGELVTQGHDAVMAWKFDGGAYKGVSLKGVKAVAVVTCDENLSVNSDHKSQIVVDSSATSEQAAAVGALIQEKCGEQLGKVVQVNRAPVSFTHSETGYVVKADGIASLDVSYRIDNSCCTQPGLVWYDPLSPISGRKVGYTETAEYSGGITVPWNRGGEDSAFYGAIAF